MTAPGNIIIGISGGIAAYKIPLLIRMFKKNGSNVKVVCTKNALDFVTPLTLETLSENSVYFDVFSGTEEYSTAHISITDKADAMIVAPATANIISKFANGIADDALSTTFLSFNKQVFIAPSMNTKMLNNKATQNNIEILKQRGIIFIEPNTGFLACGYDGKGRMPEPEEIFYAVIDFFKIRPEFSGKKVLVTAGPTHEAIDPVRFISNRSSGKMGFAIAEAFAKAGATVNLISGPSQLKPQHPNINLISIESAEELFTQCVSYFPESQIIVMAAAVSDFTPSETAAQKIKKKEKLLCLELKPTKDILKHLGNTKNKNQILVGFALETDCEEANAKEKLHNKNLDCIVLNSLQDKGSGFGFDTNKIKIISADATLEFELKHKDEVAADILQFIHNKLIKKIKSEKCKH